jgi:hypothetical protein
MVGLQPNPSVTKSGELSNAQIKELRFARVALASTRSASMQRKSGLGLIKFEPTLI